jgi:hypothetical protein
MDVFTEMLKSVQIDLILVLNGSETNAKVFSHHISSENQF